MSILSRTGIGKYAAFAALGFRQARAEPGELLGRVLFFGLILGVFSAIWRAVAESGAGAAVWGAGYTASAFAPRTAHPAPGSPAAALVWYVAMTEWVLMSAPLIQFQMEQDIRRGDVAYEIARPASWLASRLAHGLGALGVRAPVMLVVACAFAWAYVGAPPHPARLALTVAFGLAAAVVMTVFHLGVGVVAFWLGDVAPAYWVWQKLLFVLGGLLLPLQFYPELFVRLALLTPFPALLAGPASLATDAPLLRAGMLAALLAGWGVLAWALTRVAFARAVRRLQLNGG